MREANHCLPFEELASSPVLHGVARGLEDLFPVIDLSRSSDGEEGAGTNAIGDADEAYQAEG
jgi:hypothetical protein